MAKQNNSRSSERLSILQEISRLTTRLQSLEVAEAEAEAATAAAAAPSAANVNDDNEVVVCETYGGIQRTLRPGVRVQIMSDHNKSWHLGKGVLSGRRGATAWYITMDLRTGDRFPHKVYRTPGWLCILDN